MTHSTRILNIIKILSVSKLVRLGLIGLIVTMAISYMIFANSAVRKVAVLEKTRSKMQSLLSTLSDLQSENFLLSQQLTNNQARSLGLVEVSPLFISKSSSQTSLSLR